MVHLSVAGLNSLANILREAQSLYNECHLIINKIEGARLPRAQRAVTIENAANSDVITPLDLVEPGGVVAPDQATNPQYLVSQQPSYGIPSEIQQQDSNVR
jgi:hypothetical protein